MFFIRRTSLKVDFSSRKAIINVFISAKTYEVDFQRTFVERLLGESVSYDDLKPWSFLLYQQQ